MLGCFFAFCHALIIIIIIIIIIDIKVTINYVDKNTFLLQRNINLDTGGVLLISTKRSNVQHARKCPLKMQLK